MQYQQQQQQRGTGPPNPKLVKAQERLQKEVMEGMDEIERKYDRSIARKSYACAVSVYDKAGNQGNEETIARDVQTCMIPHQRAQSVVNNELNSHQGRIQSAQSECEYRAQDMVIPFVEMTEEKANHIQETYEKCMLKVLESNRKILPVTFERMQTALVALQSSPEMIKMDRLTKPEYKEKDAFKKGFITRNQKSATPAVDLAAAAAAASSTTTTTTTTDTDGGNNKKKGWFGGWFGGGGK